MTIKADYLQRLRRSCRGAVNIGYDEDHRCPECRRYAMLYYTLDGDPVIRDGKHGKSVSVGFFCGACGWGNAGSVKLDEFKPEVEVMYEPDESEGQ